MSYFTMIIEQSAISSEIMCGVLKGTSMQGEFNLKSQG